MTCSCLLFAASMAECLSSLPTAFVVGASLAVAGCVLQSVLRNPLAEPYMLGIVGGGSLFVALALHAGLAAYSVWVLPCASFLGSCLSLALVVTVACLASRRRPEGGSATALRSSGATVILAGFVTGSFTGSLQMLVLSYAEEATFATLSKWMFGNLHAVSAPALACGALALALALTPLLAKAKYLDVLELGRDEAECLGIDTRRILFLALACASLATATAVALAGAIGFVGLVVPHFVKRLSRGRHRSRLVLSACGGGIALILADLLGRLLPGDVSAGVVCALLGTPFFLYLLIR